MPFASTQQVSSRNSSLTSSRVNGNNKSYKVWLSWWSEVNDLTQQNSPSKHHSQSTVVSHCKIPFYIHSVSIMHDSWFQLALSASRWKMEKLVCGNWDAHHTAHFDDRPETLMPNAQAQDTSILQYGSFQSEPSAEDGPRLHETGQVLGRGGLFQVTIIHCPYKIAKRVVGGAPKSAPVWTVERLW